MLAWKVATFQQSVLYRVVSLASGIACLWNAANYLTSMVAARALFETLVLIEDFAGRLDAQLAAEDLESIDSLVMNRTFATRDAEWIVEHPESKSLSILTLIDRLDKSKMSGIRRHYDSLSEKCHPNSAGHHQMFSTLNRTTRIVSYSEHKHGKTNLVALLPALSMIRLFEKTMDALDQSVLDLAELQHRLNPAK